MTALYKKTFKLNDFILVKIRKQHRVEYCFCTKDSKNTEGGKVYVFLDPVIKNKKNMTKVICVKVDCYKLIWYKYLKKI